jgi:hypothetical protein
MSSKSIPVWSISALQLIQGDPIVSSFCRSNAIPLTTCARRTSSSMVQVQSTVDRPPFMRANRFTRVRYTKDQNHTHTNATHSMSQSVDAVLLLLVFFNTNGSHYRLRLCTLHIVVPSLAVRFMYWSSPLLDYKGLEPSSFSTQLLFLLLLALC